MNNPLRMLTKHWVSIILVTFLGIGISLGITAAQPFEYRSGFSLLVIEKTDSGDAFAAAKSAESASLSLAQIIYTTSFYDQVRDSGLVDMSSFPTDAAARRKLWEHMIETRTLSNAGMLKIAAYSSKKDTATSLAYAVATVLAKNGADYLGTGKSIVLKVVDSPLTTNTPARPNYPLNLVLGFLVGFGVSAAFHFIRDLQPVEYRQPVTNAFAAAPEYIQQQPRPVQPEAQQQPPTWAAPTPVITTMFSPEAMARLRETSVPPQPSRPTTDPDSWEMPDMHRNRW